MPATYQSFSLIPSSNFCWIQNRSQKSKEMVASWFTFLGSRKVKKYIYIKFLSHRSWFQQTADVTSHISKTRYRNNDILVTSGLFLCKWKKTLMLTVELWQIFLLKTFQWLPTRFNELLPLDFQLPVGRPQLYLCVCLFLILFPKLSSLLAMLQPLWTVYLSLENAKVISPSWPLYFVLLLGYSFPLFTHLIPLSYWFQSHKKAIPNYPILKSHSAIL